LKTHDALKTILITGATNGIGLAAAKSLAALGHFIIVHGRSEAKCTQALQEIKHHTPHAQVEFIAADFADLAQVRAAAQQINSLPRLDTLINNAGAMFFQRQSSAQGHELTLAVNHLAPFLLTHLLVDKIAASGVGRIINVASNAHRRNGPLNFDDLMHKQSYKPFGVYCHSKLANMLFTLELAKRTQHKGIKVCCLHPGVVRSGFAHNSSIWMRGLLTLAGVVLMISPEQGAKTLEYLACEQSDAIRSGGYYVKCILNSPAAFALDEQAALRLWQITSQLTDLSAV
jgi:retinol dehydrogenase 12